MIWDVWCLGTDDSSIAFLWSHTYCTDVIISVSCKPIWTILFSPPKHTSGIAKTKHVEKIFKKNRNTKKKMKKSKIPKNHLWICYNIRNGSGRVSHCAQCESIQDYVPLFATFFGKTLACFLEVSCSSLSAVPLRCSGPGDDPELRTLNRRARKTSSRPLRQVTLSLHVWTCKTSGISTSSNTGVRKNTSTLKQPTRPSLRKSLCSPSTITCNYNTSELMVLMQRQGDMISEVLNALEGTALDAFPGRANAAGGLKDTHKELQLVKPTKQGEMLVLWRAE